MSVGDCTGCVGWRPPNPARFYWVGVCRLETSPALRGIVGVGPTTLCGEVNSGIHACETVPCRVITIIVESALIGYVRIWIIMLVEKEMLNVYLLSVFWYMRILYMCIWYVYFVVYSFVYVYVWWPLQWILRAPPTQDDGPLHAAVSREDDGEFVGFQWSRSCTS